MSGRKERFKRSAGTVLPPDTLKVGLVRGPKPSAMAADIAALDRGEGRTMACHFRGFYGGYPKKFRGYFLNLAPGGPVLRPGLIPRLWTRPFAITEELVSARVRPFESQREARSFLSTGFHGPGGPLEWAGWVVVSCQTSQGVLEFGITRPDVPVLLHYVELMHQRRQGAAGALAGRRRALAWSPAPAAPAGSLLCQVTAERQDGHAEHLAVSM